MRCGRTNKPSWCSCSPGLPHSVSPVMHCLLTTSNTCHRVLSHDISFGYHFMPCQQNSSYQIISRPCRATRLYHVLSHTMSCCYLRTHCVLVGRGFSSLAHAKLKLLSVVLEAGHAGTCYIIRNSPRKACHLSPRHDGSTTGKR